MPLELRPLPKLTYKLRLTPQMRLSLNLLQLPLVKLKEYIKEEVEKNPLLELIDAEPKYPKEETPIPWTEEDEEKKEFKESLITSQPTLQEHLLKQLHLIANSDDERKIGELIIGNIDDNGYLGCPLEDIAESSKITKSQVEKVLNLIQTFDPIGVGARDLRECLLLQLNPVRNIIDANKESKISNGVKAKTEENFLTGQIIDKCLPFLEKKRYTYIAKKLKCSVGEIKEAIKEIACLEPKPGRSFSTGRTIHLIPDAILKKNTDGYEVILNGWELPRLTINAKYKEMLQQGDTSGDVRKYLLEKLNAARALMKAISKRKETIQEVIEDIVNFQKDCFDKEIGNFRPMTLTQIANRIGKHKSTVSRAIANKYLHTPYGILELRYFLNSGIKQRHGEIYSSKNIKLKISEWIRNEDKKKPLTDQDIADLFRQKHISVSRRTIAKYRTQLKILPSMSR